MARRADHSALALCAALACSGGAQALPDVQVNGLLPNQAVVTIDGQQRILKAGKPGPEGVTLVSSDSKVAVFEWQGERFERTLSKQITSNFSAPAEKKEVRIERGHNDHYFTTGAINGRPVNFLVDTGAYTVAMNHTEADRLGLDWRSGKRNDVATAGGGAAGYEVILNSVTVGGITLNNIKGAVIVADTNTDILLGMSFLSQMEMREENNTLVLRKKY